MVWGDPWVTEHWDPSLSKHFILFSLVWECSVSVHTLWWKSWSRMLQKFSMVLFYFWSPRVIGRNLSLVSLPVFLSVNVNSKNSSILAQFLWRFSLYKLLFNAMNFKTHVNEYNFIVPSCTCSHQGHEENGFDKAISLKGSNWSSIFWRFNC